MEPDTLGKQEEFTFAVLDRGEQTGLQRLGSAKQLVLQGLRGLHVIEGDLVIEVRASRCLRGRGLASLVLCGHEDAEALYGHSH